MQIEIKRINPNVVIPSRATQGSAGFDLQAAIDKTIILRPGATELIPTGLAIHIKDLGVVGVILPRSKAGHKHGLVIGNLVGVVDSDYTGQWYISAWNRNTIAEIIIEPLEHIAQAVFLELAPVTFKEVIEFSTTTERGDGGISKQKNTNIAWHDTTK